MTTRAQRHRPPGFLVILGLLLLFAAGSINRRLIGLRDTYGLSSTVAIENAPPLLAFTTVALGGFRGLLADILWLRASHLQERGDYVEVAQLSDWIAELEPRCTEIWGFHAWNMAYNISVMLPDPQDRWRWVRNGIELLRQKGLVYNPGAPGLCGVQNRSGRGGSPGIPPGRPVDPGSISEPHPRFHRQSITLSWKPGR